MGRAFFDAITRFAIRFRWLTILVTALLLVMGVYAALDLNIEMLPSIDIPSTFVLGRSHGLTDGSLMLHAYTVPIEEAADEIAGVINVESTTSTGFVFLQFANEFGEDQARIQADLRAALDEIGLPLRRLDPPEGMTPQDMIGELPPEVVLYLLAWGQQEDVPFLVVLDAVVWEAFSPEVLGALPESAYNTLSEPLAQALRARAAGEPTDFTAVALGGPPPLPLSWQTATFVTAQDIIELAGVRSLGRIFNDFVELGYLEGPVGTVSDLTLSDLQRIRAVEEACEAMIAAHDDDATEVNCSLLSYLDTEALAALVALVAQFGDAAPLPPDLVANLDQDDQNAVATVLMAQWLTGEAAPREVPVPPEWLFEPPQLLAFSFDDIPLAALSISAESDDLSPAELRHLVENEIVPQLEGLDVIADIAVQGGERIRLDVLNPALVAEGLEPLPADEAAAPDADDTVGEAGAGAETGEEASTAQLPEGPPLPPAWAAFAAAIPEVEELNTADDLLQIQGVPPSMILNMAAENPLAAPIIGQLSPEALLFLADYEEAFFANLSDAVLAAFPPETLAALPEPVQARAARPVSPALGEFWQRLGAQPEFPETRLTTAADLAALDEDAAATLNRMVQEAPAGLEFLAIQLINDLSPEVIGYLADEEPGFTGALSSAALCAFSPAVLNVDAIAGRIEDIEDAPCDLAAIAAGEAPSAAEQLLGDGGRVPERIVDPEAPALPPAWSGIAGFVGARELDSADDLFYTTGNGGYRPPSALLAQFPGGDGERYLAMLPAEVLLYVADADWGQLYEEDFFANLSDAVLVNLAAETLAELPEAVQQRAEAAALGIYVPQASVTRTNLRSSMLLEVYKTSGANTVSAWADVEQKLEELEADFPGIEFDVAFEQASFIEESISGVAREGGLGAIMAVIVILIFLSFSLRSTLVTAISIPTSVAIAFIVMRWLPGTVHEILAPAARDTGGLAGGVLTFLVRLFPESVSLNIMTLSGLTVAIGRVVDDSIVVLENIYRNIQQGSTSRLKAVLQGTRDVSVAIFAATVTTVVVFLPIGLFGGVVGEFFLPFGLAVTYALLASFFVAITVVPLLAYLFIHPETLPEDHESRLERGYRRAIEWALSHRLAVMLTATVVFFAGIYILMQRPTAFLPSFGEPTITVTVDLPRQVDGQLTGIATTDAKVRRLEEVLTALDGVETIETRVGSSGQNELFSGTSNVTQTSATLSIRVVDAAALERLTPIIRQEAEAIFNDFGPEGRSNVTVSGASVAEQGFGGFSLVVSGDPQNPPTLAELQAYNDAVVERIASVEGITNVGSSLEAVTSAGASTAQTYIRINGVPAIQYTAELETQDTLGVTNEALAQVRALDLPENFRVSQGFASELQTEGFQQMFVSMAIAVVIVYLVMVLTFGSLIHPITILFSLPLAVVGAAVGLAVTDRVLGLSAVVGLLMLVGIVVTNAIVLLDRVQSNRRERGMDTRSALIRGGMTRLRPILMTAIATMVALLPLAIGFSEGAIVAAELGTVVIGGLFSSTFLTLIVVPVVYSLFNQAQERLTGRRQREQGREPA